MFAAASMASAFRFGGEGKGFLPMTQDFHVENDGVRDSSNCPSARIIIPNNE